MQFPVPQFIEEEDKIFGPFTLKQSIYIAGGAGIGFILYSLLPFLLAILFMIPVGVLVFMLAFKPIQGRPFSQVIESAFKYIVGSKLYIWKKVETKMKDVKKTKVEIAERNPYNKLKIPTVTEGKLDEISLKLDTKK